MLLNAHVDTVANVNSGLLGMALAGDDTAVTHGLLDLHDPGSGFVVVHPTPGSHGLTVPAVVWQNELVWRTPEEIHRDLGAIWGTR